MCVQFTKKKEEPIQAHLSIIRLYDFFRFHSFLFTKIILMKIIDFSYTRSVTGHYNYMF